MVKSLIYSKNWYFISRRKKKICFSIEHCQRRITRKINFKIKEIEDKEINSKLESEKVDVTLPEREISQGKIHQFPKS